VWQCRTSPVYLLLTQSIVLLLLKARLLNALLVRLLALLLYYVLHRLLKSRLGSPECLAVVMQLKSCVSSYMMRGATHGAFLVNPEMLAALSARLNSHYHNISTSDKSLGHLAPIARHAQSDAR
jgi:hypothetical protein